MSFCCFKTQLLLFQDIAFAVSRYSFCCFKILRLLFQDIAFVVLRYCFCCLKIQLLLFQDIAFVVLRYFLLVFYVSLQSASVYMCGIYMLNVSKMLMRS